MDPDQVVGTEIAGFAIESVLGRGGMGTVYVARQRSPDRRVALKLITPAFAHDEVFRRRFLREAAAAAAIEHPHILPVYAAGESDGVLYLAMRLVDGEDLREVIADSPPLPLGRIATVIEQVGAALDAAHARGLVHRDVKPGNILLARRSDPSDADFCYLTDFGVSTWTASSAATVTSTGQMVGTANYVAPEQIEGGHVDGLTDLYSLGCVLYECLTGNPPFGGRGPAATLYAHLHEEAAAPSSVRPGLPAGLDIVTKRALAKDQHRRFASGRELANDLRSVLAGAPIEPFRVPLSSASRRATPVSRSRERRRWLVVAAVLAALLVTAVGVTILALGGGSPGQGASPPAGQAPRILEGVQVTASHTAPSSTDAAGNPVTYLPKNVIDGDVSTAWRTPGDGRGESVTLIFDNPIDVVRIGMIPGYAKTDPQTGVNRFFQNRIIKAVAYEIPGLPDTKQTFEPQPVPQLVPIRRTTSRITIRILDTTPPGGLDYTAISEIYVYGYEQ